MSGLYYTDVDQLLRSVGLTVSENSQNKGWQTRARSSGGFPAAPLCVFWHHTASNTSIANDLAWQCHNCPDSPVGNMTIDRDGVIWPVAAGASNCSGKGGPASFSRGTIPLDGGNTRGWQIEVANDGVGGPWPQVQIDSYFLASNTLNAMFGNQPTDVISHSLGTGNGWTNRKIDPAKSGSVQGPWRPRGCNGSSDTWVLDDIRSECARRAGSSVPIPGPGPGPGPSPLPPGDDDDMIDGIYKSNGPALYVWYSGGNKYFITDDGMWTGAENLCRVFGRSPDVHQVEPGQFAAMGLVIGPRPDGTDEWGNYV